MPEDREPNYQPEPENSQINNFGSPDNGGGANLGGGIKTEGGDFVGRDQLTANNIVESNVAIGEGATVVVQHFYGKSINKLEIERGLRVLLENQIDLCRNLNVPFRTPSLLLALLDIQEGIAAKCFDTIESGLATSVHARLDNFVRSRKVGDGAHFEAVNLATLESIQFAGQLALEKQVGQISTTHLFEALLSIPSSTLAGLKKRLGEKKFTELKRLAEIGGPSVVSTGDIEF